MRFFFFLFLINARNTRRPRYRRAFADNNNYRLVLICILVCLEDTHCGRRCTCTLNTIRPRIVATCWKDASRAPPKHLFGGENEIQQKNNNEILQQTQSSGGENVRCVYSRNQWTVAHNRPRSDSPRAHAIRIIIMNIHIRTEFSVSVRGFRFRIDFFSPLRFLCIDDVLGRRRRHRCIGGNYAILF